MTERDEAVERAMAAFLAGREDESLEMLAQEHNREVTDGHPVRAARLAFWIAFSLFGMGEPAKSSGWNARARRLLDEAGADCVERGYVLLPQALERVAARDIQAASEIFAEADRIGQRFHDLDLRSLARQGQGRILLALGRTSEGVSLFDEVMVAATAGELRPFVAGVVYCSVIAACFDLCDLRRAQEWTEALNEWCLAQPGLVQYRGECQAHRAEILRLHGEWAEALAAAERACATGTPTRRPARGAATYEIDEVHRLRGEVADAEAAYQRASDQGRAPIPGLALLRLAQGQFESARAAITRALAEPLRGRQRFDVCCAAVQILLACGDAAAARQVLNELETHAPADHRPLLEAMVTQAEAVVLLAEKQPSAALAAARSALAIWRELGAPFDTARAMLVIARACECLGDADGAALERNAATRILRELGADPAAAGLAVAARPDSRPASLPGGLSARELEVLRLVAQGESNRAIAAALAISEKTVARHLSNIFTKLDLSSRAAATAFAFKNRLVE